MKNVRNLGKAILCLLLCCSMLNCTAFAAGPEQVQTGDVVIVFNDTKPMIQPLMEKHIFADESGTCTYSQPYKVSGVCHPVNGSNLYIEIANDGDTDLNVKYTITVNGTSVVKNETVTPESSPYYTGAYNNKGEGLDCSFVVEVSPKLRTQVGSYTAYISQTW